MCLDFAWPLTGAKPSTPENEGPGDTLRKLT